MKKLILCLILGFTAGIVFGQAKDPTIVVSTFSTRGQAVTRDDAWCLVLRVIILEQSRKLSDIHCGGFSGEYNGNGLAHGEISGIIRHEPV